VKWTPNRRKGVLFGIGWIVLLALIDVGLIWRVVAGPINGWSFICALLALLSLPAFVLLGYWIYGLSQLRYEFDRNRLIISTGAVTQVIPMNQVDRVLDGRKLDVQVRMKSLCWPGYWIGQGVLEEGGMTLSYAVDPPTEQVFVVTPTLAYGISTPDVDTLMDVFETALSMGSSAEVKQETQRAAYVGWSVWGDRLMQVILLCSIAVNLLLFGILCFRFPSLPVRLPMHYDVAGMVDRIAPREQIFALPVIGLIVWGANSLIGALLYRSERVASYLVWSGALVVQLLFFLALWNLTS